MKNDSSSQESATYSSRLTRNQQAVLDVLLSQADALSAQEFYSLLRERHRNWKTICMAQFRSKFTITP